MTRLVGILAMTFGLAAACKSHEAREAERSAERVRAKSTDLRHEQKELGKAASESAKAILDELGDVAEVSAELERARRDFEEKRAARIANLEGRFAVLETMPALISRLAAGADLTAGERVKVDEKLQVLRVRIEEAKLLLGKLQATAAADWTARDDEITHALRRVDKARDEAAKVIEDNARRAGS